MFREWRLWRLWIGMVETEKDILFGFAFYPFKTQVQLMLKDRLVPFVFIHTRRGEQ